MKKKYKSYLKLSVIFFISYFLGEVFAKMLVKVIDVQKALGLSLMVVVGIVLSAIFLRPGISEIRNKQKEKE